MVDVVSETCADQFNEDHFRGRVHKRAFRQVSSDGETPLDLKR